VDRAAKENKENTVMSHYQKQFIAKHVTILRDRFQCLMDSLEGPSVLIGQESCVRIDPLKVRLAVNDFKTILAELKTIK
jgi:hypothetical protein